MKLEHIFLLHGKGGSPEGSVLSLEQCLRPRSPQTVFHRPLLLHADGAVLAEDSLADLRRREIPPQSLVIGVSLGGLLAARLQETGREDLSVICVNSPTWVDAVRLERRLRNRVAFYSSHDEVIAGRTAEWPQLALAFDLPWLTHDTSEHARPLAELIWAYLEGKSVEEAIRELESSKGI
jgi:pimeloyl-ACP methyl ester carboxylesterase